jgi:hypothetical protein
MKKHRISILRYQIKTCEKFYNRKVCRRVLHFFSFHSHMEVQATSRLCIIKNRKNVRQKVKVSVMAIVKSFLKKQEKKRVMLFLILHKKNPAFDSKLVFSDYMCHYTAVLFIYHYRIMIHCCLVFFLETKKLFIIHFINRINYYL